MSDLQRRMRAGHSNIAEKLRELLGEKPEAGEGEEIAYSQTRPIPLGEDDDGGDIHPAIQVVRRNGTGPRQYQLRVFRVHDPKVAKSGNVYVQASCHWVNPTNGEKTWLLATAWGPEAGAALQCLSAGDDVVLNGELTVEVKGDEQQFYLKVV